MPVQLGHGEVRLPARCDALYGLCAFMFGTLLAVESAYGVAYALLV